MGGRLFFLRVDLNRSQPRQCVDTSHIFFQPLLAMKSAKNRDSDGIFLAFCSEIDRANPRKLYGFGEISFVCIIHGFLIAEKTPWSEKYALKDGVTPSWTYSTHAPNTLIHYDQNKLHTYMHHSRTTLLVVHIEAYAT